MKIEQKKEIAYKEIDEGLWKLERLGFIKLFTMSAIMKIVRELSVHDFYED